MKGLFISFNGFSEYSGISKKKISQIKAFRECGIDILNCYYMVRSDNHRVWMLNDNILVDYGKGVFARIKQRVCFDPLIDVAIRQHVDFIYIRHDFNANPFLIHTIKKIATKNVKLILEIPTYPYDKEFKNARWTSKISLLIDKLFRQKYASYMFRIVTYTTLPKIWNKQTIQISNGVDFEMIKEKKNNKDINSLTSLNLISVAEVHDWHALDRLIEGLGQYYKKNPTVKVFLHIVGGVGPVENSLFNKLITQYEINKYVLFYGPLFNEALDSIFDITDIGIGSLGRHRSHISDIKTLKNREYAARGMPFIYSETDDDFDNKPYIMKVPPDESPINILQVLDFYKFQNMTIEYIRESIKNLSWKKQIEIIVNKISNPNNNISNADE